MPQSFTISVNGEEVFSTERHVVSASVQTARGELGHLRFGDDAAVQDVNVELVFEGTLNRTLRQEEEEARVAQNEAAEAREKEAAKQIKKEKKSSSKK